MKTVLGERKGTFQPRIRPVGSTVRSQHPAVRILALLLPFISLLLTLSLLIPSAEIWLYPSSLREIQTLTFSLAEQSIAPKLALSYSIHETEIEGDLRIPTTGRLSLPDQFARGEVVFTNRTDEAFTIPAGTSVRSSNPDAPYLLTDKLVELEGGEGEQVTVSVTAAAAGLGGNLAVESVDRIDGVLALSLSVSNPAAIVGGSMQTRAMVSTNDRLRVKQDLERELLAQLRTQIANQLYPQERMLESSFEIAEILFTEYDADVGEAADSIRLRMAVRATAVVVDAEAIQELASRHLISGLPTGYLFSPGSPEILEIREINQNQEQARLEVELSLRTHRTVDLDALRARVRGRSLQESFDLLETIYPNSPSPEIHISPSWFPLLPLIKTQINIRLMWEDAL